MLSFIASRSIAGVAKIPSTNAVIQTTFFGPGYVIKRSSFNFRNKLSTHPKNNSKTIQTQSTNERESPRHSNHTK
jgi:uncharacterized protein YqkB